jgi:hypothetical protein
MKVYTADELHAVLESHLAWLKNEINGACADLSDANLSGANLRDANLSEANLSGANMPGDYTFEVYKSDVIPALLTAGGKSLADVVSNAWDCHKWTNCPMAYAFGVHGISEIPPLYRESAELFISLFDANIIPRPTAPPNSTQSEQV